MKKQKIKYTIAEEFGELGKRIPREGFYIELTWDKVKVGDLIANGRQDKDTLLPIFFKIDKIGKWGIHDVAFMSKGEEYCIAPFNWENNFIIIREGGAMEK